MRLQELSEWTLRRALDRAREQHDDEAEVRAQVFARMGIAHAETRLGPYLVRRPLGRGGAGMVFDALDTRLGRSVAIKFVRGEGLDGTDASRSERRLLREARAIAALRHPGIVEIYDVGRYGPQELAALGEIAGGGGIYVVMEHLDGGDLSAWMRTSPSQPEIVAVLCDVGRALHHAHVHGLVHRDVKPSNVVRTRDGTVKLIDFGIARAPGRTHGPSEDGDARSTELEVTVDGTVLGTLPYMAPEQFEGQHGPAVDQYAFCVMAIELLTGARPFRGTAAEQLQAKRDAVVPQRSQLPRRLREVLVRGLDPDPRARHPDMAALVRALAPARARLRGLAIAFAPIAVLGGFAAWPVPSPMCQQLERDAAAFAELAPQAAPGDDTALQQTAARLGALAQASCAAQAAPDDARACALQRAHERSQLLAVAAARSLTPSQVAGALAALPPFEQCEPATATAQWEPVAPAAIADDVASLRARVAVSRALVDIGRIDESAAEAQDVVDQAQALGFAPLSIEAATALGFAELSRNRVDEAERGLQAAYWSASELDHVLETQRAAELLSVLYSRKRRDVAATQTWERHAETALQRLGHPALASARLAAVRGSNRNDRGELAAAATEFAQAAATLEQLGDAWIEQRATMLNNLGEVRSRAGDHAGAESALLQARGLLQGRAGSGVSIVKVLSHLSTLRRRQGRGDEALALATEAIERLDAAYPGGHPWRAPLLNSRGAIEGDRGAYLDAIADFDAALAAASSSSAAPELAGYHANLAAAWGRLQDWPASARHARLALELMPAGDTRRTRAWLGAAQASYHLGEHVRARSELAQLDGVTLDDPALAAELDQLRGMLRPTP